MARENIHNNSNHLSLLGADLNTTNHNSIAYESALTGSWDSSSSTFITTPFQSELDSTETYNNEDDAEDEFIRQLTRQIEDYMLQEEEEDDDNNDDHNTYVECVHSHNSIPKMKNQNQDQLQHRVVVNSKRGRRWKMSDSTQQMKCYRGGRVHPMGYGRLASPGSGMRAVFFNRPGSKITYNGTGVFLPPLANDPTAKTRKIPGYSAALVPTRVLEALEQHFNKSFPTSNNLLQTRPTHKVKEVICNKSFGGDHHQ